MSHRVPSEEQRALAATLGLTIRLDSHDVAAARLFDAVAVAIGFEPPEPASERQKSFADSLGTNVARDTKRVASAKIGESLFQKNQAAIASLELKPGDRVVRVEHFEFDGEDRVLEREFIISSIQPNGRVFFKGGNGQGAWPTQLRKGAT
jgi:hypothetical protein